MFRKNIFRLLASLFLALSPILYVILPAVIGSIIALGVLVPPMPVYADAVDLYWVGGTASWDGIAGTKWATISGGAGGHAIPTSTNKVIFDSNSGVGTVTVSGSQWCSELTLIGGTGNFTGTLTGLGLIYIAGPVTMSSEVIIGPTLSLWIYGAGNVTLSNKEFYTITHMAAGGTYTYQGPVNCGTYDYREGVLDSNGQVLNATYFNLNGSGAKTMDFTGSIINVDKWNLAGTVTSITTTGSTINVGQTTTGYFYGAGKTYDNVVVTTYAFPFVVTGSNTFSNLTVSNTASRGSVAFYNDQAVTGVLTLVGINSGFGKLPVVVDYDNLSLVTLTAASVSATNTAFRYIKGAGAASWDVSASNNIDCGFNEDITFTSSDPDTTGMYWVGDEGTSMWDPGNWSIFSGGSGGCHYLYAIFNAYFDSNSGSGTSVFPAGPSSLGVKNVDATGFTGTIDDDGSGYFDCYGNITIGAGVSHSSTFPQTHFSVTGTSLITSHGIIFNQIYLDSSVTTVSLQDNLLVESLGIDIYEGTFNTNNYSIGMSGTTASFSVYGTDLKSINLGSSSITITSGDWDIQSSTGLTFISGTSTITLVSSYASAHDVHFGGYGLTYNNVVFNINSATHSNLDGSNTFSNLSFIGVNSPSADRPQVELSADQVITGNFTSTGYNSSSRRMQVRSNSLGTSRQITLSNPAIVTNTDFRDIAGNPASMWDLSATNSGDLGGNYGITFITAINCYWVMNSGSWSDINHWALTSGGTGGTARIPVLGVDVAVFDANSTTFGGRTITMDLADVASIDASQAANNPTFSATTVTVYGSVSLGTVTWSVTNTYFAAEEPTYLLSNSSMGNIYVAKTGGGTLAFGTDIVSTGTVYLSSGILDLNDYDLTALAFDSSTTTYVRQILMGQGTVTLNSTAATTKWNVAATNLTVTRESSLIRLTNSGANAQTFAGAGLTYGSIIIEGAGNYALSITGANTFRDVLIDRSVAAKTVRWPTSVTTVVTNLYIPISGVTVVTMYGTTAPPTANVWTISKSAGVVITDYISLEDSTAAGGAVFYAGSHSTNVGHNTGWLFSDPANPFVETSAATEVTHNSVSLNGQLLSITPVTVGYAYFQVGLTTSYGLSTPEQAMTGIGTYTRALVGLEPGTTYHYRAAFRYSGSSYTYGSDAEFTTAGTPAGSPIVITGTAVNLTATSATLQGTLSDMGLYTTVYTFFEYGTSTFYGTQTAEITQADETGYSTGVTGLTDGVTYYFRAVARYDISSYVYGDGITFRYVAPGGLIPVRKAEEAPPTVLPVPQGLNLFSNPMTFPITAWPGYQSMSKAADALGWTVPITYSIFFIGIAMLIGLAATLSINTIWGFIVGFGVTMGAFTSSGIGDFWVNLICVGFAILLGFLWRNN